MLSSAIRCLVQVGEMILTMAMEKLEFTQRPRQASGTNGLLSRQCQRWDNTNFTVLHPRPCMHSISVAVVVCSTTSCRLGDFACWHVHQMGDILFGLEWAGVSRTSQNACWSSRQSMTMKGLKRHWILLLV